MSLPIDTEALAALHAAEHEYGERLMDLAQERAVCAKRPEVMAEDVEWAARRAMGAVNGTCWRAGKVPTPFGGFFAANDHAAWQETQVSEVK